MTYPDDGEPAGLSLSLGAWNRLGVVSSGRIPYGKWGNLPGGETFIAPVEGTAQGGFWLNGSFNGYVIPPKQALLLNFERGRLVDFEGPSGSRNRFERLIAHARDGDDPNWNVLCELGIGVNQGLEKLTGNALFDEKCLGTLHIALGENTNFGGQTRSKIHEDLVTRAPSLQIDGKDILRRGEYTFDDKVWKENIENWPPHPTLSDSSNLRIARGLISARQRGSKLRVECAISERLCSYTLGDDRSSSFLAAIYSKIPVEGHEKYADVLAGVRCDCPTISDELFAKGVSILMRHRVIVAFPFRETNAYD